MGMLQVKNTYEAGEPQNTYYNGGKLAEAIRAHYLLIREGEIEA